MSDNPDIVRLEEQVKTLYRMVEDQKDDNAVLRSSLKEIKDNSAKRVWTGLFTIGTITLTLIGTITTLVVYIFKKEVGG